MLLLQVTKFLAVYLTLPIMCVIATPVPVILSPSLHQSLLTDGGKLTDKENKQAVFDMQSTIEEVQKLLDNDKKLPRLTRGEIEDLFEQVTREEYEKSIKAEDTSRAKHMRALMLVLPYSSENNSTDALQELYNRPPITKVVAGETPAIPIPQKMIPPNKVEIISVDPNPTTYKPMTEVDINRNSPTTSDFGQNPKPHYDESTLPTPTGYPRPTNDRYMMVNINSFDTSPSTPQMTPELEELFENLGIPRQSQSKKRFKLDNPTLEEYSVKSDIPSVTKPEQPVFTDSRTSEMNSEPQVVGPKVKSDDFIAFKPLPLSKEASKNLQSGLSDYLKMFGIVDDEEKPTRTRKSLSPSKRSSAEERLINFQRNYMYPNVNSRIDLNVLDPVKSSFNPVEQKLTDAEDLEKLNKLLETIRQLQQLNINLTEDSLSKLDLSKFNLSSELLAQGPNPIESSQIDQGKNEIKRQTETPEPIRYTLKLNLDDRNGTEPKDDDSIELFAASSEATDIKLNPEDTTSTNDTTITDLLASLKLQNLTDSSDNELESDTTEPKDEETTTAQPTSTTESSSTTTVEPKTGIMVDLGDSFPGGLDPVEEEEKPPERVNGLYLLKDWNTFLEVGEDPDKVVIRYSQLIGDPRIFLPVTVP